MGLPRAVPYIDLYIYDLYWILEHCLKLDPLNPMPRGGSSSMSRFSSPQGFSLKALISSLRAPAGIAVHARRDLLETPLKAASRVVFTSNSASREALEVFKLRGNRPHTDGIE